MRIDENKVFVFNFDAQEMGGGCSFPIRAESRQQASDILQKSLSRFQTELAMEFPKVEKAPITPTVQESQGTPTDISAMGIPSEVLEMRIDTLMKDLGGGGLAAEAKAQTILNWTELPYTPENFTKIIADLELILAGKKEVPVKGKKK